MKSTSPDIFATDKDGAKWNFMYEEGEPTFERYIFNTRLNIAIDLVESCYSSSHLILDLGCGSGPVITHLLSNDYHCFGADFSSDMLNFARKRLQNNGQMVNHLIQLDGQQLPFADQSFDCVICLGVISYMENPAMAIAEIQRVLKPGGHALISFRNHYNPILNDPVRVLKRMVMSIIPIAKQPPAKSWKAGAFLRPQDVKLDIERTMPIVKTQGIGIGPIRIKGHPIFPQLFSIKVSQFLHSIFRFFNLNYINLMLSDVIIYTCRK